MTTRAVSGQWQRAAANLIDQLHKLTAGGAHAQPDSLYHFTDCQGLIGIFEHKTLWASLATALNDPSEVRYGIDLARGLFNGGTVAARHFLLDDIDRLLSERAAESRAYVVSFCGNLNLAGQWLHYGRAGTGVAVGFYPGTLAQSPFELFRTIYDPVEQVEVIRQIIRTIDDVMAEWLPLLTTAAERDRLKGVAADLAADHLWMAAPKLKHPSFSAEAEWRLIAYELRGPGTPHGEGPAGRTFFRSAGGRVVPYKKLTFDVLPAFEVVLGASCPMVYDDLGVLVLMEEKLGARLTVKTSEVPVRA